MTPYFDALRDAMTMLAEDPRAVFLGQAVVSPGTAMFRTLEHLPEDRRIELPVFENTQMGMSTGLALAGWLPISIYPRINFLLEATSQLVQHTDKLPLFSDFRPRVIVRTAVATDRPLDPGCQHVGDYSYELEKMLSTVKVVRLFNADLIVGDYRAAMEHDGSTILVEYSANY
jgi:pyruvate/2-oxoglutarate/acetoin dehydrogenase E1 component